MLAAARHAFTQGPREVVIGVLADSVLFVGRDVAADYSSEWRRHAEAARERRATFRCGMATGAIACLRQILAARNQGLIGGLAARLSCKRKQARDDDEGGSHRVHHGLHGETISAAIAVTIRPSTNIGLASIATR